MRQSNIALQSAKSAPSTLSRLRSRRLRWGVPWWVLGLVVASITFTVSYAVCYYLAFLNSPWRGELALGAGAAIAALSFFSVVRSVLSSGARDAGQRE